MRRRNAWLLCVLVAVSCRGAAGADARLAECLACHDPSGANTTPQTPILGGQPAFYVLTQLFLFRGERRANANMAGVAKNMTDADLQAFADAVAKLPPPVPAPTSVDTARFERGRALARRHHCTVCHRPDLAGTEQVPRLANQREQYVVKALREFKSGKRTGYGQPVMPETLVPLDDAALLDLAHYIAHFPAAARAAH